MRFCLELLWFCRILYGFWWDFCVCFNVCSNGVPIFFSGPGFCKVLVVLLKWDDLLSVFVCCRGGQGM